MYADRPAQLVATTSDANIVHAAVTNMLARTTNGGQTWTQVRPGAVLAIAASRSSSNTVYAALEYSLIKSTDAGVTFKNASTGLPNYFYGYFYNYYYFEAIAADSSNINTAYVSFTPGTYKTTNGGKTWSNTYYLDCGQQGEYEKRVIRRMLGRARK